MDISQVKGFFDTGTAAVAFFGAILAMLWKSSKSIAQAMLLLQQLKKSVTSLEKTLHTHSEGLLRLTLKFDQKEKEHSRLEGALEVQRKDLMSIVTRLQEASSSLGALWKTLEHLHPNSSRRFSDRASSEQPPPPQSP